MTPILLTFANQKGGVGKSTLCLHLAHYLHSLGIPVTVVDCDGQATIVKLRQQELASLQSSSESEDRQDDKAPFPVLCHLLSDKAESEKFFTNLVKEPRVHLVDSPGNLREPGLLPLFAMSHYIACPFQLEETSLRATGDFIKLIFKMRRAFADVMKGTMLFIPNRVDNRFGTKAEKERISRTKLQMSDFGKVTPDVDYLKAVQQISTLATNEKQLEAVKETFSFICQECGISTEANPESTDQEV